MTPITAKAGDAIRIEKQLTDGSGRSGDPVDLTDETVRVYIQYEDDTLVANQEVEYVDRENGKVAVVLQPSQTSNIGRHDIEWVVDPQGDPTTYPGDSYDTLRTESPLDRELDVSEETPPDLAVTTLTVEGDADLTGGDLTGVGTFEAESVKAEDSVIGGDGQQGSLIVDGDVSDWHAELLFSVDSPSTSATATIDLDAHRFIDIHLQVNQRGGDSNIRLEVSGASDGDYNYVTQSGTTLSQTSDANNFYLAFGNRGGFGRWTIEDLDFFSIAGYGVTSRNEELLKEGYIEPAISGTQDLIFTVDDDITRIGGIEIYGRGPADT